MKRIDRRTWLQASACTLGSLSIAASSYRRLLGANERIGIGFIGYGLIGARHVADFRQQSDCDLIAVCDAHRGRAQEGVMATGSARSKAIADFRQLLDDKDIHAVVISTPDHWHALQTMMACDAGKDVYVEKPMTLFQREGQWMQQVAQRTRRVVQVGTQQRSGRHYQRARSQVQAGDLGQVMAVRIASLRNVNAGFGQMPDGPPPPQLDWDMWLGPAPLKPYNARRSIYHFRWYWDYSGGQMTNLGAHHLDIVDWFIGLQGLRRVSSTGGRLVLKDGGETPDTQDAIFDFGRFTLSYQIRECSGSERNGSGLEFAATRGQMTVSRSGYRILADPKLEAERMIPGIGQHPVGGPEGIPRSKGSRELLAKELDDTSGSSDEQYLLHVRDFLDCIRSRQTPVSDLASGHRTATACHLANLSLRLGHELRWDHQQERILGNEALGQHLSRPYRAPWDRELQALGVN